MIKTVTFTNHHNESLAIQLNNPWPSGFVIMSIRGLDPPKSTINSTELSTTDGSVYNSARIPYRNIVVQLKLLEHMTIEEARHILYKYFPLKKNVKVTVETDTRNVYATGYVETNEVEIFSKTEIAQISIMCLDPFLYSTEDNSTPLTDVIGGFEFPFENEVETYQLHFGESYIADYVNILYEGDHNVGITINIHANGNMGDIRFYSRTTDEEILLQASKIASKTGSVITNGDDVEICTVVGQKKIVLTRDGVKYNLLSCISRDTGWIHLENGENIIVASGNGLMNSQIYIYNKRVYEGI